MTDREKTLQRALYICAPAFQGGKSNAGRIISEAHEVPYPISMDTLKPAAIAAGLAPDEIWPWLETMKGKL